MVRAEAIGRRVLSTEHRPSQIFYDHVRPCTRAQPVRLARTARWDWRSGRRLVEIGASRSAEVLQEGGGTGAAKMLANLRRSEAAKVVRAKATASPEVTADAGIGDVLPEGDPEPFVCALSQQTACGAAWLVEC